MRRRLRRYRLRHKIRAIKTRPNNPLRFLQRKNSIRRYLENDLTYAARKTTFRTRKRFPNKQYTPKSKDQPLEADRTHFDIRFNNSNDAIHRPTIIFLLSHKITNVQQKTTNRNNQSNQTIRKNNPRNTQSIIRSKQNITNKHEKLSHQSNVKSITKTTTTNNPHNLSIKNTQRQTQQAITKNAMFLNIKISQTATASEPTTNTLFIKTQYNRKRQNNITYTLR